MRSIFKIAALFIGVITLISLGLLSCREANLPPAAILEAFPAIGDTSIIFEFNAGKSEDDRSYAIGLRYRWDINDDGVWDTEFAANKSYTHQFIVPGTYSVAVEVRDVDGLTSVARDSVQVFGENTDIDTLIDARDGTKYRTVKIGDRWWMAENLRYGIEISTEKEQTDNDTVERYRLRQYISDDTIGGVYRWQEAMNYHAENPQGICPDGWHLPTEKEFELLHHTYPYLYGCKYFGKDGLSNLNLDIGNWGQRWEDGTFWDLPHEGSFWSSSYRKEDISYWPYCLQFESAHNVFNIGLWDMSGPENHWASTYYLSVRCIKNL